MQVLVWTCRFCWVFPLNLVFVKFTFKLHKCLSHKTVASASCVSWNAQNLHLGRYFDQLSVVMRWLCAKKAQDQRESVWAKNPIARTKIVGFSEITCAKGRTPKGLILGPNIINRWIIYEQRWGMHGNIQYKLVITDSLYTSSIWRRLYIFSMLTNCVSSVTQSTFSSLASIGWLILVPEESESRPYVPLPFQYRQ